MFVMILFVACMNINILETKELNGSAEKQF